MRERSDRSFGCERSEPSRQDRAPRSEAQRSAVQLLVVYKVVSDIHRVVIFFDKWLRYKQTLVYYLFSMLILEECGGEQKKLIYVFSKKEPSTYY